MIIKPLYRYDSTVTPIQRSETDEPVGVRLIADEGKVLIKGEVETTCIDTDTAEGWTETEYATDMTAEEVVEALEAIL